MDIRVFNSTELIEAIVKANAAEEHCDIILERRGYPFAEPRLIDEHGASALPAITGDITLKGSDEPGEFTRPILFRDVDNTSRPFRFVTNYGKLRIENCFVQKWVHQGGAGAGSDYGGAGGGGAGMGGAIFNTGALELRNVNFRSNEARGGKGGGGPFARRAAGGGGGLDGDGARGGIDDSGWKGAGYGAGGHGGGCRGGAGGSAGHSDVGGPGGGGGEGCGGGGAGDCHVRGKKAAPGGKGGFGGGGGGAGTAGEPQHSVLLPWTGGSGAPGGAGGFGGGGGGGANQDLYHDKTSPGGKGDGGGGDGGRGTCLIGFRGGSGGGGGGAALGGAIFNERGEVTVEDCVFHADVVTGGAGGKLGQSRDNHGKAGQGRGRDIFNHDGRVHIDQVTYKRGVDTVI